MDPSIISLIVTIVALIMAAIGFLRGFFKGIIRSAVDIIFVIVGIVVSLIITNSIVSAIMRPDTMTYIMNEIQNGLPDGASNEYIGYLQEYIQSGQISVEMFSSVMVLPVIIIGPFLFMLVYALVGIILKIPKLILEALVCPKGKETVSRVTGGIVGALRYVAVFMVFILPLIGYMNFVTEAVEYARAEPNEQVQPANEPVAPEKNAGSTGTDEQDSSTQEIITFVETINDNFFLSATYTLGGKMMFNSLTCASVGEVEISLEKEVKGIIDVYKAADGLTGTPISEYGSEQTEALDKVSLALSDSEYLPLLLSNVISFVSTEWLESGHVMGFEKVDLGDSFNPTLDRVLNVTKNTSSSDVKKDIETIKELINHSVEQGLFEEMAKGEDKDIWKILENSEFLEGYFTILYDNERTRGAIPYLSNATINYICRLYDDINGTVTIPKHMDRDKYTKESLSQEAEYISSAVRDIRRFIKSANFNDDAKSIIINGNFEALGRGFESLRSSLFIGNSYDVLFYAILHSKKCQELGIVDDDFITKATEPDSDLDGMLVARQNLMKLAIALHDDPASEKTNALVHSAVEAMLTDDADSIRAIITEENLKSLGIQVSSTSSLTTIMDSMLEAAQNNEYASEEEKKKEVELTENVVTAITSTAFNGSGDNMFKTGDDTSSTSNMSSDEFVDSILSSKLSSSMVKNAASNEENDPYNVQSKMTDSDRIQMASTITEKYSNPATTDEERETLIAIATVFGIIM